jgi:hypothetical protein
MEIEVGNQHGPIIRAPEVWRISAYGLARSLWKNEIQLLALCESLDSRKIGIAVDKIDLSIRAQIFGPMNGA